MLTRSEIPGARVVLEFEQIFSAQIFVAGDFAAQKNRCSDNPTNNVEYHKVDVFATDSFLRNVLMSFSENGKF